MNYIVNWTLSGFRGVEHKAGDVIEAAEHEAAHIAEFIKAGVITLVTTAEVDLHLAGTEALVRYVKEKFNLDLDPTLNKDAMLAEIAALEAGTEGADDGDASDQSTDKPVAKMTKPELVAYAKSKFNYDLAPTIAKPAMLAEIAALEEKAKG